MTEDIPVAITDSTLFFMTFRAGFLLLTCENFVYIHDRFDAIYKITTKITQAAAIIHLLSREIPVFTLEITRKQLRRSS